MMTDKNCWYYKNLSTGEISTNKEVKNSWCDNGFDVAFYRWSDIFGDFIDFMIQEGRKNNGWKIRYFFYLFYFFHFAKWYKKKISFLKMKFFNAGKIFIILKNEMLAVKKKKDNSNLKNEMLGKIF